MDVLNEVEWLFNVIKDHPWRTLFAAVAATFIGNAVNGQNSIVNRVTNDMMDERQRKQKDNRGKERLKELNNQGVWITEDSYEAI